MPARASSVDTRVSSLELANACPVWASDLGERLPMPLSVLGSRPPTTTGTGRFHCERRVPRGLIIGTLVRHPLPAQTFNHLPVPVQRPLPRLHPSAAIRPAGGRSGRAGDTERPPRG